jgi:DNA-binding XRE family transcriptional regulator
MAARGARERALGGPLADAIERCYGALHNLVAEGPTRSTLRRQRPPEFLLRLAELRRAAGLTQAQLARRAGLPRETVARLEGSRRRASATSATALAQALAVAPDELTLTPPAPSNSER